MFTPFSLGQHIHEIGPLCPVIIHNVSNESNRIRSNAVDFFLNLDGPPLPTGAVGHWAIFKYFMGGPREPGTGKREY